MYMQVSAHICAFYGRFDKICTKTGTFWAPAPLKPQKIFPGAFGAKAKFFPVPPTQALPPPRGGGSVFRVFVWVAPTGTPPGGGGRHLLKKKSVCN